MIKGLQLFKNHFADYSDRYVLIGGTACTLNFEEVGLGFRATKDLDIVLHIEALDERFVKAFWQFIKAGGYENKQRSTDKNIFYRFDSPINRNYPSMLELFSRLPDKIHLGDGHHLTPIPINEAVTSLSAILLNNDYYQFIHQGKMNIDGLPVLTPSHLIPLKARAWMDLIERRNSGEAVDEKDIRKHKNDIMRLFQLLSPASRITIPQPIRMDMQQFLSRIGNDKPIDLNSLGLKNIHFEKAISLLGQVYCVDA